MGNQRANLGPTIQVTPGGGHKEVNASARPVHQWGVDGGYVDAALMPDRRQWVGVAGGVGPNWGPLTLSESYVLPGGYAPHPDQSGVRVATRNNSNSTWIDEYCRSPLENPVNVVAPWTVRMTSTGATLY